MKRHLQVIICMLGAAACFYFADSMQKDAIKLEASSAGASKLLFPKNTESAKAEPPPNFQPDPPDRESLWQADPLLVAKQPEVKEALAQADVQGNQVSEKRSLSKCLYCGGFACLGVGAFLQLGLFLGAAGPRRRETEQSQPLSAPAPDREGAS